MKKTIMSIMAVFSLVELFAPNQAKADVATNCAEYWGQGDKHWWNNGKDNNDWIKTCKERGSAAFQWVDLAWLADRTSKQYVVCLKYTDESGAGNLVYEPSYTPPAAAAPCEGVKFAGVIYKDCLTPSQPVKFSGAYKPIGEAAAAHASTVTTLAARPSLEAGARLAEKPIQRFIPTQFTGSIFNLHLSDGATIALTGNHPMVLGNGRMVPADTLHSGDNLLRADGDTEVVLSVTEAPYSGTVWTVRPKSEKKLENVMVVKDLLTGSSRFTEEWSDEETRLLRARSIDIRGL